MSPSLSWKSRTLSASESLLRAAADRFAHQGYHGTSVETIARQAGVNKALVSYHFGGKEQLYLAVRRRVLSLFSGMNPARAAPEPPGRAHAIRTWFDGLARQTRQVPALPMLLLREELGDGPAPAAEGSVLEILALRLAQASQERPSPANQPPQEQDITRARIILVSLLFHLARGGAAAADAPLPPFLESWLTTE
jgi:AcrR family transcriptional regulator